MRKNNNGEIGSIKARNEKETIKLDRFMELSLRTTVFNRKMFNISHQSYNLIINFTLMLKSQAHIKPPNELL